MTSDQDELLELMREWAADGPLAPRVLDTRSYPDVTAFVLAYSSGLTFANYDKALDQFALEMHALGRLGDDYRHRIANSDPKWDKRQ